MSNYLPLSTFKYNQLGQGSKSIAEIDAEYRLRVNGPSSIETNLIPLLTEKKQLQNAAYSGKSVGIKQYPIFFVETKEINYLEYRILENSRMIRELTSSSEIPGVAINSYINSLLTNEIVFTNEIEGVKTNPREIGTIVGEVKKGATKKNRRLESTIRTYQDALNENAQSIKNVEDFRRIYETLLAGEIESDSMPDGKLFRDSFAYIGNQEKAVHTPPDNEKDIQQALQQLVDFMNNDSLISLEKAIVTHFMFENTHPFKDGNGRTGRYLLSSYLSSKLDNFTGLAISTAIHDNLSTYYKLFREADDVENRAELTFFISGMLKIIEESQIEIITQLANLRDQLKEQFESLKNSIEDLNEIDKSIIYLLLQSRLFAANDTNGILDSDIIRLLHKDGTPKEHVKRRINTLEERSILVKISGRPLQHVLNNQLFIEMED